MAYHVLIGSTGKVVYNRALSERTEHTKNKVVANASIAIVLTGDFTNGMPSEAQMKRLQIEIDNLNSMFNFEAILPHAHASPSGCAGNKLNAWLIERYGDHSYLLEEYKRRHAAPTELNPQPVNNPEPKTFLLSRYYTPVEGQDEYYRDSYEDDFKVNCLGNCFSPADGGKLLTDDDNYKVAACPKSYPLGTKLNIEGIGVVTCRDRGGKITESGSLVRLDIYVGVGMSGLSRVKNGPLPHHPRVEVVK